jgi:hypothetical protein
MLVCKVSHKSHCFKVGKVSARVHGHLEECSTPPKSTTNDLPVEEQVTESDENIEE